jgi:arsenate reductase
MTHKKRVLFLCTHNSARSQMAEGMLRHLAGDRFGAYSAGIEPTGEVHPCAVEAMREVGVDISDQYPKGLRTRDATRTCPTTPCWRGSGPCAAR